MTDTRTGDGKAAPTRADLESAAERGDPAARMALVEMLATAGEGEQAAAWLRRAVEAGDAYAAALLGVWEITGYNLDRNEEGGLRQLREAASAGESAACAILAWLHAVGLAAEEDWDHSLDWLVAAARLESPRALTQLGLLAAPDAPAGMKVTLWWAAASRGFDPAQQLLGKALASAEDARSREAGLAWLGTAARAGNPCAMRLAGPDSPMIRNAAPLAIEGIDFDQVRQSLSLDPLLAKPEAKVLRDSPRIITSDAFIAPDICDYLSGLAAPRLKPARVNPADGGAGPVRHDMRSNWAMQFELTNSDPLIALVDQRMASLVGEPLANQECTAVLRYRPGERYADHFDFIDPDVAHFRDELAERGQRVATVLIYLNDDFEGGATAFPTLDLSYRGKPGDAIAFRNVDAEGEPDRRMLHTGCPPDSGEKWLLSKWVRNRKQLGKAW